MDYRIRPPTKGFDHFQIRRAVGATEVELHLLDGSYQMSFLEAAKWMADAGFRDAHRVLDAVHNVRIVDCDLTTQAFSVPADQDIMTETTYEIDSIMDCVVGQRLPFDPSIVVSPFDQQFGFNRPSYYVNPRSNGNGQ